MSTRKALIFSAICAICVSRLAIAEDHPTIQLVQLGQWMAYYYVEKDTSTVNDALKLIQNSQIAEKGGAPPLVGFLTPIAWFIMSATLGSDAWLGRTSLDLKS